LIKKLKRLLILVLRLLEEKKDCVEKLASRLLELETLNHEEIVSVLGKGPFSHAEYIDFLHRHDSEQEKPSESGEQPSSDENKQSEP
jgi:hypothetical protein